jgi:hypothetical protein
MKKETWSEYENKLCCKICVEHYVVNKYPFQLEKLLTKLSEINKKKDSIRMKIQNIKFILDDMGIENTLEIAPLKNASMQNRKTMLEILEENKLI